MEIDTYQRNGVTVTLLYDDAPDSPADWGNYKLVTFDCRLITDVDRSEYFNDDDMPNTELDAMIKSGKAVPLEYYKHSGCIYRPATEDNGTEPDGFIIFEDAYIKDVSYDDRQKYAAGDLETYTQWANGEVYGYRVTDQDGEEIESLYGVYGADYCESEANTVADNYLPPRKPNPASRYHGMAV